MQETYLAQEARARVNIDRQLEAAGWRVQPYKQANVSAGPGVAVREFILEKGHGRVDYLLFLNGQPAGVIEAKPEGDTLTEVERQSGKYVDGLPDWMKPPVYPLPFIYESTGKETRFTNGYDPDARSRQVYTFHRPETLIDWARQMILLLHRWYPERRVVVIGDGEYAALEFLAAVRGAATTISRLRLDARLFAPPPPRTPGQTGRPCLIGQRLPTPAQCAADSATTWTTVTVSRWYGESDRPVQIVSDTALWYHTGKQPVPIRWVLVHDPQGAFPTQCLLRTDPDVPPDQIIAWFVLRWQVEVTFHEARQHLGVRTQRYWSDQATARTTPALFGLFSLVTLLAHRQLAHHEWLGRQAAWYTKTRPTFIDALALVRRELWAGTTFQTSSPDQDLLQLLRPLMEHLTQTLCYAA